MFTVLIVNDDGKIARDLAQCVRRSAPQTEFDIEISSYGNQARSLLRKNTFDILLIDIALPSTADGEIILNEGMQIVESILDARCGYKVPQCIIGITFNHNIVDEATKFFQEKVNLFIRASCSVDYKSPLSQRINQFVRSSHKSNRNAPFNAFCAVTCALDEEYQMLLKNGWKWESFVSFDDSPYHIAYIKSSSGEDKKIVAALSPRMGMLDAAIVNMRLVDEFNPEYLTMTGICAAAKKSLNFGDIIVAEQSWDWSIGKWITENGIPRMQNEPYQIAIVTLLKNKFKNLIGDNVLLNKIYEECPYPKPKTVLSAYLGPLASGPAVVASSEYRELILQQHRKLLGIDMESFAVFGVCDRSPVDPVQRKCFVIKSVADYADESKGDEFHSYAAYTSAMFFTHFIQQL